MTGYQPGVCNIGRRQRLGRAGIAAVAFAVTGGLVGAYALALVPEVLLVAAFVPLALGFEWAFQAYESFCVRLALLGRYDFSGASDDGVGRVADPGDRRADQVHAAKITAASVLLAAVATYTLVVTL